MQPYTACMLDMAPAPKCSVCKSEGHKKSKCPLWLSQTQLGFLPSSGRLAPGAPDGYLDPRYGGHYGGPTGIKASIAAQKARAGLGIQAGAIVKKSARAAQRCSVCKSLDHKRNKCPRLIAYNASRPFGYEA